MCEYGVLYGESMDTARLFEAAASIAVRRYSQDIRIIIAEYGASNCDQQPLNASLDVIRKIVPPPPIQSIYDM